MSTPQSKRVMFYVQNLLGVGHLRRSSLICEGLLAAGHEVHMILGGRQIRNVPFTGAYIHKLPEATAADPSFSAILNSEGKPINDSWRVRRREKLLSLLRAIAPNVLLIEHYPFGRRQFRFELLPLLKEITQSNTPPMVMCSVRDLLVSNKKESRVIETSDIINQYFDKILVHGDPNFLPLDVSFPKTASISSKLYYTGYIVPNSIANHGIGNGEVIVASGGGRVGYKLLKTAIAAKAVSSLNKKLWRILVGPHMDEDFRSELKHISDEGIIIEENRSDYPTMLANCALSISQAGYNTLMDVLIAQCPSVVVPFSTGNETEQFVRARLLSKQNYLTLLNETLLTPVTLAQKIDKALKQIRKSSPPFNTEGVKNTVRHVTEL